MAIPITPTGYFVQTANATNLASWDVVSGATSYVIQRSLDNVTFTTVSTLSGSPLATSYLDTSVVAGTTYYYQVAAVNISGSSAFTTPQGVVPSMSGELSLGAIRLKAQQRADRVNSNFVTKSEWNSYINQALFELYDLLITVYQDYYVATPYAFVSDGTTFLCPLPNGVTSYNNGITNQPGYIAPPFYKLMGVDLGLQTANNAYVTLNKFNFIDRNKFVYPNSSSSIYGVFNLQYRMIGNAIEFIPTPSAGQVIRVWYIPRLTELLQDTDITNTGISGWVEYVIVKAAYYALTKEESDTSSLVMQLVALTKRIEESAMNRDAGQPDKISDTSGLYGQFGGQGYNGPVGGWTVAPLGLLPGLIANNIANHGLGHSILSPEHCLRILSSGIGIAYISYLLFGKFGGRILFSRIRNFLSRSSTTFVSHIRNILSLSTEK